MVPDHQPLGLPLEGPAADQSQPWHGVVEGCPHWILDPTASQAQRLAHCVGLVESLPFPVTVFFISLPHTSQGCSETQNHRIVEMTLLCRQGGVAPMSGAGFPSPLPAAPAGSPARPAAGPRLCLWLTRVNLMLAAGGLHHGLAQPQPQPAGGL